jgi:GNAT superfamily N-acetyltransferase
VPSDLSLCRHDAPATVRLREPILEVYSAAEAQTISADAWANPDKFWQRLVDLYAPTPDFEMVTAWLHDQLVGYAFGSPREDTASIWSQVTTALPDIPVPPANPPIYIFREFAVHPRFQRNGYGRRLHNELLTRRPEPLAHLLVRVDNAPARSAYAAWGWRKIGQSQPFPDSPVLDALVIPLPLRISLS